MSEQPKIHTLDLEVDLNDFPIADFRRVFDSVKARVWSNLRWHLLESQDPRIGRDPVTTRRCLRVTCEVKAHVEAVRFEWNTFIKG